MTDMPKTEVVVLKTDQQGRVRTPAARRASLLDEFERSGLNGPKFAALAGLKYQTFAACVKRRRQGQPAGVPVPANDRVQWLEAVMEQAKSSSAASDEQLVVQLPGGARVVIAHPQQAALVATLLRVLEKPC